MTEEVTTKKRSRRKRRSKAEIEAEKAAKLALEAEEAAKEAEGFEKIRARDEAGHFIKDDPSTPENEAWEWRRKEDLPELDPVLEELLTEDVKLDEVVTEMFEESVNSEEVVEEEPAPPAPEPVVSKKPKLTIEDDPVVDPSGRRLSQMTNRFKKRRAMRRFGL